MNAIEFIETLEESYLISHTALESHQDFIKNHSGVGTYEYFRTKYNNKCRQLNITILKVPLTTEETVSVAHEYFTNNKEKIHDILPVRKSKNYKTGDEAPDLPKLIPTGTLFDRIISDRITTEKEKEDYKIKFGEEMSDDMIEIGGFTRQCIDIVAGDPGAGKTYSRCILAAKAKIFAKRELNLDIKVGFISGEMRESEWAKELKQCELLKELEVDYMLDYVGYENYEDIFWEAFSSYDLVVIDSLPAILSHMKMSPNEKRTEKIMIFDFIRQSLKLVEKFNNNAQLINQANKDGNYKGGTELPHMMSSMSFVKVDGQQRYMEFSKNRNNGNVGRKVFFNKIANGDIVFNEEVYRATYEQVTDKKQSISEFMEELSKGQVLSDDDFHDDNDIMRTPQEMGTSGSTEDELREINENFIPRQVDLIDSIAEIEAENA